MGVLTLDQLVQSVEEVPALPDTALKVLKMTEDPTVSARDIGNAIAIDVALTSKVLRIANSAYYGMPRSVSTVQEAIVILGMQVLRNVALAAASYDLLRKEYAGYGIGAGELWKHSISCAVTAQIIARKTRAVRSEEAFVAGLLHDIGKVILNVHVAPQFQAIMALAELDDMPFHLAEKEVLGFDHAEVGARLGEKWNLPSPLCAAISGHHLLERGEDKPELTALIHIANVVCQDSDLTLSYGKPPPPLDPAALQTLEMDEAALEEITAELIEQLQRAQATFELEKAA
jgi:putative nucleotidyltransferase with HDIG domain